MTLGQQSLACGIAPCHQPRITSKNAWTQFLITSREIGAPWVAHCGKQRVGNGSRQVVIDQPAPCPLLGPIRRMLSKIMAKLVFYNKHHQQLIRHTPSDSLIHAHTPQFVMVLHAPLAARILLCGPQDVCSVLVSSQHVAPGMAHSGCFRHHLSLSLG